MNSVNSMNSHSSAPPAIRRSALPPGKGRSLPREQDAPQIPATWLQMPENTPEEKKAKDLAGMLYTCDDLHARGRTDLAESFAKGRGIDWKPSFGPRAIPQTRAMEFSEPEPAPAHKSAVAVSSKGAGQQRELPSEEELTAADYNPFREGR